MRLEFFSVALLSLASVVAAGLETPSRRQVFKAKNCKACGEFECVKLAGGRVECIPLEEESDIVDKKCKGGCKGGWTCVNGVCEHPEKREISDAKSCKACGDLKCLKLDNGRVTCVPVDKREIADKKCKGGCKGGWTCVNGVCEHPEKRDTRQLKCHPACKGIGTCDDGVCVHPEKRDIVDRKCKPACKAGKVCVVGVCENPKTGDFVEKKCKGGCKGGWTCVNGVCEHPEKRSLPCGGCPNGFHCINDECRPPHA